MANSGLYIYTMYVSVYLVTFTKNVVGCCLPTKPHGIFTICTLGWNYKSLNERKNFEMQKIFLLLLKKLQ